MRTSGARLRPADDRRLQLRAAGRIRYRPADHCRLAALMAAFQDGMRGDQAAVFEDRRPRTRADTARTNRSTAAWLARAVNRRFRPPRDALTNGLAVDPNLAGNRKRPGSGGAGLSSSPASQAGEVKKPVASTATAFIP